MGYDPATLMLVCYADRIEEGKTSEAEHPTPEDYFGFNPHDVATIHTHKHGVGDGVWFRLKDGRIINSHAEVCEPDGLYDQTEN